MIRVISKLFMAVIVAMAFTSCNEVVEFKEVDNTGAIEADGVQVLFSVDKFENGNGSRTIMDPNNGYMVSWAEGDVVGIFPREGYQEPFEIPLNQVGNSTAMFDGGYWALKSGLEYNAYYPFDKANFESADMKEQISVSYLGQSQNGTTCGAGAYDYTYSDWKTAGNGSVSFSFHHLGAIVIFNVKYPATTTYTKLTMSANSSVIPITGSYDLTANSVAFVASTNADHIDLTLTNCSGTAGETGTFYMMLPPMDLSGKEVTLTLTSSAGTTCVYDIDSPTIVKGKKYEFIGEPISSNVSGTIDGWEDGSPSQGGGLTINWAADATVEQKSVLTNLVNNMVLVEGGTFMMGGDYYNNEQPIHQVTITNDYYMGKFEVTQEEWVAVMGSNPSDFSGTNLPVECVSWNDIVSDFLPELNRLTGLTFRLPTEAEWEFAARGGNNSNGYIHSGSNTIGDVAWYYDNSDPDGDGSLSTHAVGTKLPNELGLYDMSGNVWEWCSDWYGSYSSSSQANPTGPATGSRRVLRGGDWSYGAVNCRVARRPGDDPDHRLNTIGFRLALSDSYGNVGDNDSSDDDSVIGGTTETIGGLTINWAAYATPYQKTVLTNLVNNMVLVEGGTFMMGGDSYSDERPIHQVTLTNDYYMGKFEVTQEEWVAVMGSNPSDFSGTNLPVECVSWNDIVSDFLPELNRLTGLTFRLPTEAEWEFAARGGNNSNGYIYSGSNTIGDVAWYYDISDPDGDGSHSTHAVGTKLPNELGLYDMSGNVLEWCSDWCGSYSSSSQANPTGPATGSYRVFRGGSWGTSASYCRVAFRIGINPDYGYDGSGFRLAL